MCVFQDEELFGGSPRIGRPVFAGCPNGPPDFKGAIGVSDSGVAGCDIHTPVFQWHETRSIPRKIACSFSYLRALYKLVGRTNDAAFRGFPTGDVLFFGARGENRLVAADLDAHWEEMLHQRERCKRAG
jgi:hypothetical protein